MALGHRTTDPSRLRPLATTEHTCQGEDSSGELYCVKCESECKWDAVTWGQKMKVMEKAKLMHLELKLWNMLPAGTIQVPKPYTIQEVKPPAGPFGAAAATCVSTPGKAALYPLFVEGSKMLLRKMSDYEDDELPPPGSTERTNLMLKMVRYCFIPAFIQAMNGMELSPRAWVPFGIVPHASSPNAPRQRKCLT
ncbi:protein ORF131 [Anguillid herpesvirus 1]|nr:protein ORF131 [Anguillid herpesvirus 1]